jgi:hypothetical protein
MLTSVSLPSTLVSIGKNAFSGCTKLERIELPNKLKTIGEGAFSGLYMLRKVILPSSLESVGKSAFSDCSRLVEITVPNISLVNVFENCNIVTVYFNGTKEEAKTHICVAFPYNSKVLICCTDGEIQQ